MENLDKVIDELLEPYQDGFEIKDIWDTVSTVMSHAEELSDLDTGVKKKQFTLDVLDTLLSRVDLPGPDWVTHKAIMWFAPSIIDKFVEITKSKFSFGD